MFGCGLPVCALGYSCISELVTDGETGLLFSSAQELAEHLAALLHGFNAQVCLIMVGALAPLSSSLECAQAAFLFDACAFDIGA